MVSIIIDTNILKSGNKDFTTVHFLSKLEDITREIESNDFYQDIKILIPQIVIDELYMHQLSGYNEWISKIQGLKLSYNEIEIIDDYKTFLDVKFKEVINSFNTSNLICEVIPYPNHIILPQIINRAINKKAPFEGTDKNSDKGFKDVILWESLLEYKRNHPMETIILYSSDKRICDNSLLQEFTNLFRDNIHLLNRTKDNENTLLYNKLSDLFNKKYKRSFAEEIKIRLLELISGDLPSIYFEGEIINEHDGKYICTSTTIEDKNITNIEDSVTDGKIKFQVHTLISINAKSDENVNTTLYTKADCDFYVDYLLHDDIFYLKKIDSNIGTVDFIDDGVLL